MASMPEEAPGSVRADRGAQRGAVEMGGGQPPRTVRRTAGRQPCPAIGPACGSCSSNAPALHGRRHTRLARPWSFRSSGNAGQHRSSVRFPYSVVLQIRAEVGLRVNVPDDMEWDVQPEYLRKGAFNDLRQSGNALVGTEALAAEPAR